MANKKISEFTTASSLNDADLVPIVQSGVTKKTLFSTIKNLIQRFSAITEKTSIADNDIYLTNDSADSNNQKKVKHSTIKSNIQNINALTLKASPGVNDLLILNDVADSNNPKKMTIGTLPAAAGVYAFEGDTAGSAVVTLATAERSGTGSITTDIKIKKPVVVMVKGVSGTQTGAPNLTATISVYQNGGFRLIPNTTLTIVAQSTTAYTYAIPLNPGSYRLTLTLTNLLTSQAYIVATGVWDGALSTASILEA